MRAQISQAASDYTYAQFLIGLKNMTTLVKAQEIGNPFYSMRGLQVLLKYSPWAGWSNPFQ